MCGIAGIFFPESPEISVGLEATLLALGRMHHRGPDHHSTYQDQRCVLGHARLKIIDTSDAANQPMKDESGNYILVFNGEIFNFRELKKRPSIKDITFHTSSDTEVLMQLLIHEGESVLNELNGFFAFSFYNKEKGEALIVRDRFGVKPLWYFNQEKSFAFASELRALLAYPFDKKIDTTSLSYLFTHTYIPGPASIIEGAKKLRPGHLIRIRNGKAEEIRWYTESRSEYAVSDEALFALLDDAVRLRLISDVPIGVFLSGGIDSAVVAALATRHTSSLQTFSIGFPDYPYLDESAQAEEVARHLGTQHVNIPVTSSDARNAFHHALERMDEPFADSSAIAYSLLSSSAKPHITVALGGDGADEIFGGYRKHMALESRESRGILNAIVRLAGQIIPENLSRGNAISDRLRQLRRYSDMLKMGDQEAIWYLAQFHDVRDAQLLLNQPFSEEYDRRKSAFLAGVSGGVQQALLFDQRFVLPNDMLVKVDSMSMGSSLEVRSPFLDYRVVEFANRVPVSSKLSGSEGKIILRRIFSDLLPASVFQRRKKGFEIPLETWLRGPLKEFTLDTLSGDHLARHGLLNQDTVENLLSDLRSGNRFSASLLWSVLTFQVWYDRTFTKS